jgi:4-carboxymuconolactone decarboxylase
MTGPVLAPDVEALVRLSALVPARREAELDEALAVASRFCESSAIEEALLQSYLFLGYPIALNAVARWRAVAGSTPAATEEGPELRRARGADVCQAVYGGQYDRLRANVRRLHPDMERWMVEEGYGKVLGRPGLDLPTRELCIVALLAVMDVPRQLYSHIRGALNVGAEEEHVARAVQIGRSYASAAARASAEEVWEAVRTRTPVED